MCHPRVLVVYGTRPEAIKLAPLVKEIEADPDLDCHVVVTGQHREMLDQVNELFGIEPDADLDIMGDRQTLAQISSKILSGLDPLIVAAKPAVVVVQGDTTTSTMAAVAAFYRRVPVVHLEAGLRSGDLWSPFPEEANRKITAQVASLHLAPTDQARRNLLDGGVPAAQVVVTGNTVVDALLATSGQGTEIRDPRASEVAGAQAPLVLVTLHRRENWGVVMSGLAEALAELAERFPRHVFLMPLHRNPMVRDVLVPRLGDLPNVVLTDPLEYSDFTAVMSRARLILSDSGGVQEEAPSLGKPVLVLRDTTERPEAVAAGAVRLVGTDPATVVRETSRLLTDDDEYDAMARAINPYGDGRAASRSLGAIRHLLGLGPRPDDFRPEVSERR